MATELVISTLNVNFSSDTGSTNTELVLEVDDREDGYNNGNTSFKPGDSVYYWLFKGSKITKILEHFSTAGALSLISTDSKKVEETLTFTNSNETTLQYPPSSTVVLEFLGRYYRIEKGNVTPGSVTLIQDGQAITTSQNVSGVTEAPKIAGIVRATYTTTGEIYLLSVEKQTAIDFKQAMVVAIGQYEKIT